MWLFAVALVLGTLKTLTHLQMLELPWVAELSWWWVLGAFGATAVWWMYADYSGLTRRDAESRIEKRKNARLQRQKEALRMPTRRR